MGTNTAGSSVTHHSLRMSPGLGSYSFASSDGLPLALLSWVSPVGAIGRPLPRSSSAATRSDSSGRPLIKSPPSPDTALVGSLLGSAYASMSFSACSVFIASDAPSPDASKGCTAAQSASAELVGTALADY